MLVTLLLVITTLRPAVASLAAPTQAPSVSVSTDPIAFAGLSGDLNVDSDELEFALSVIPLVAAVLCVVQGCIFTARPFLSSFVPALDTPPPKRFA